VLGTAFLFALSWWMIGSEQLIHFGRLLQALSGPAFEGALPAKYVDLRAFVWLLFHFNLGVIPLFLVLPCAYFFRDRPWITILVTLILNTYAPVHDLVLLVPILIAFGKVNRTIVALFLFSLVAESIAQVTRVQILTPLLMYLVWQNRAKK
jgi:hypothetical protein